MTPALDMFNTLDAMGILDQDNVDIVTQVNATKVTRTDTEMTVSDRSLIFDHNIDKNLVNNAMVQLRAMLAQTNGADAEDLKRIITAMEGRTIHPGKTSVRAAMDLLLATPGVEGTPLATLIPLVSALADSVTSIALKKYKRPATQSDIVAARLAGASFKNYDAALNPLAAAVDKCHNDYNAAIETINDWDGTGDAPAVYGAG